MSSAIAKYPATIWDGTSVSRTDAGITRHPDYKDWDQAVAELIALQKELDSIRFISAPGVGLLPGQPVYLKADGSGFALSVANGAAPLRDTVGLIASLGVAQRAGTLILTPSQWDAQTGESGGLTPLVEYFLSDTAGKITKTRPATTGDTIKRVGLALNATFMLVEVRHLAIAP